MDTPASPCPLHRKPYISTLRRRNADRRGRTPRFLAAEAIEAVPLGGLAGQLVCDHVDVLDARLGAEQISSLRSEFLTDATGEVGLAGLVVGEHVEDPEGRFVELQGEPGLRTLLQIGRASCRERV